MRITIIGAGPAGLVSGAALQERGHDVTIIDRDPGPAPDGTWERRGVMQFHHAHSFRGPVVETLRQELPDAWQAWLAAGAEPIDMALPDGRVMSMGIRSRRVTFETALRSAVVRRCDSDFSVSGRGRLRLRVGHVQAVTSSRGRFSGVRVDDRHYRTDAVIDASGRSGRVAARRREPALAGGPCGIAYVDRLYRLRDGADPGPLQGPAAYVGDHDGYLVILFLHERGYFSVLIVRPTSDRRLVELRHTAAFEAACRAIPALAQWTDPARVRPASDVYPGGPLMNWYRSQRGRDGRLALPGLFFVGDSVCTTTPNFGRGITTTCLQIGELLRLVDVHTVAGSTNFDAEAVGETFDAWCLAQMKPWVDDHVHIDTEQARRWDGAAIDLDRRLPADLIIKAATQDPVIGQAMDGFNAMLAGPASLDVVEPRARELFRSGWRPAFSEGPSRDELADIVTLAAS